ncbi:MULTISPECIES: hypothetical protein [Chryseobacterium]|uniref:Copper resistance protein NlpE n=1 Tax=Chryseobacterium camelliae TaxID=1265445 RepID=A0ABU0TJV6_9FLAO|nr:MULTISPECIES: hypothetical protein [Chryseobacterium]MDT3408861.1 hypothetical protein [Pseudacidovorax intermedius]MDQ1097281.1 hypothetical protein [Chryseobacterium camelliae]MDQ1101214.1 hypothetical protein [Chryseobacterium sp. SORGH_AS_1048]MDR6084660.1 hypothetical protein [Chryseobacterium sp. SORGH_AS_0909]MDR6132932.1 hypothetical protein [Chryseobacterium sp. SORGH_AS_1175]
MMKYAMVFAAALALTSCKKDQPAHTTGSVQDSLNIVQDSTSISKPSAGTIEIGTFPFPKEIKECSCYFAKNKADFEAERYIYADDAGKTAYVKLNGSRLVMNLISSSDMEVDEELSKEIESDDYKISIKGKKIKGEEALLFEGTMRIEKPDGTVVTTPIYGECGC